jgi:SnoaL-like domain
MMWSVRFNERMEARDWDGADKLLSPTIEIVYSATGERFVGPSFLASNRAYPEGWSIEVVETLTQGDRAASRVHIRHGAETFLSQASTPFGTA